MKEFSKEIINIDGVDYTLFLNRKGIITWEKLTNATTKAQEIENKYANSINFGTNNVEIEIKDDDNPFEISENIASGIEEDEQELIQMYIKLYWIMLYENHQLKLSEVASLWEKAIDEYGLENLMNLAVQMIEDANSNRNEKQLKNLTALRPKKN